MNGTDCAVIGGLGMVGQATRKSLNIPWYFDTNGSNIKMDEIAKKKIVFFCLPTPTDVNGRQDAGIQMLRDYITQIKQYEGRPIFVVRSTVIPGTCRGLAKEFEVPVCSNPELLSEDTWERDAVTPRLTILGIDDLAAKRPLVTLWETVKSKRMVITDTVTAEMMKYAFNTFFVTKIVYANQIYDMCEKVGAKYRTIKEELTHHPWGSKYHFKIFDKGGRGGGGHCFPKDIKAFAHWSELPFFKKVEELNNEYLRGSGKT